MEKLTQDLFKDPALETKTKTIAGAVFQPANCISTGPGGSVCRTAGGGDTVFDVLP